MGIKQVRIGTTMASPLHRVRNQRQHILDDAEGVVAIQHTRPEVNLPAQAPTCSHITTLLQRIGSS